MASKIKVDQLEGSTGSTITVPTGQTLTITDGLAASTISSGTLADARIPDLNASKITAGTIAAARLGSGTASSSTFLRGDGTFAAAGGGKVLQVVSAVKTSESATTSTSYVSTGLSASITPAATSSKILIICTNPVYQNSASQWVQNTIYRGGSNLSSGGDAFAGARNNANAIGCSLSINFLDSPSTTSSTTYTLYYKVDGGGGTGYASINNWNAVLTLIEIGA